MDGIPPRLVLPNAIQSLLRFDSRNPKLRDDEQIVLDFDAVPELGDIILVVRDGAFALEQVRTRPSRIGAEWLIAVLRYVGVGAVAAATLMHACGALVD